MSFCFQGGGPEAAIFCNHDVPRSSPCREVLGTDTRTDARMAPKKAITKKTAKRKAVTEVPAPAKKAAAAGGKNEVVIEACKS